MNVGSRSSLFFFLCLLAGGLSAGDHHRLVIDPGAGPIEGISLRVTLDLGGRPQLFETIYNCGCSHRIFIDRELEEMAAAEFGVPQGDRPYSIQRDLDDRIEFVVPELVDYRPGEPLFFFVRASFHMPASVRYGIPDDLVLFDTYLRLPTHFFSTEQSQAQTLGDSGHRLLGSAASYPTDSRDSSD